MSPAAQRAHEDFASLAGEAGAAIQVEDLLKHGFEALHPNLRRRLPGLSTWQGVDSLKRSLRNLAQLDQNLPLLVAARSAELMRLSAIVMYRPCRNILITDLGWSPYHEILAAECKRTQQRLTMAKVADDVFRGRLTADDLAERIRREYVKHRCDGLFLVAVSSTGARQPIHKIVEAVSQQCRFIVVDGAQEFCHIGREATLRTCDLYLTSCHKWLGGYHPLGVACYGRRRSRDMIETVLKIALRSRQIDDPLLRFVESIENGTRCDSGETVNLSSLFSSAGAVHDQLRAGPSTCSREVRIENACQVADLATHTSWVPQLPDPTLRTGILLLKPSTRTSRARRSGQRYRRAFQEQGIALSAYDNGLLRLSMPATPFTSADLSIIEDALTAVI